MQSCFMKSLWPLRTFNIYLNFCSLILTELFQVSFSLLFSSSLPFSSRNQISYFILVRLVTVFSWLQRTHTACVIFLTFTTVQKFAASFKCSHILPLLHKCQTPRWNVGHIIIFKVETINFCTCQVLERIGRWFTILYSSRM